MHEILERNKVQAASQPSPSPVASAPASPPAPVAVPEVTKAIVAPTPPASSPAPSLAAPVMPVLNPAPIVEKKEEKSSMFQEHIMKSQEQKNTDFKIETSGLDGVDDSMISKPAPVALREDEIIAQKLAE